MKMIMKAVFLRRVLLFFPLMRQFLYASWKAFPWKKYPLHNVLKCHTNFHTAPFVRLARFKFFCQKSLIIFDV
jgi:alpha-N-acetylglucosamine transferase